MGEPWAPDNNSGVADWLETPVHQDSSILPGDEATAALLKKELSFIVDIDVNRGMKK